MELLNNVAVKMDIILNVFNLNFQQINIEKALSLK